MSPRFAADAPEATAAPEQQRLAEAGAEQLDRAMRGSGTDEASIFATLTGRTTAGRQAIKDAYRRRTQRQTGGRSAGRVER